MSDLVSNPGASKWVVTTPSPKLIRQEIKNRYRQQLMEDAASLLPDTESLTKQVLSYKLPFADLAPVENQVRGILNEYMDEFQRNPFYSFSREARDKKRTLQRIVTDPRLKQLESDYENAQKAYENVRYDLGSTINYQDGTVSVVDGATGQRSRETLDTAMELYQKDPTRYRVLNVDDEFTWMTKYEGLARRQDPFTFNLSKPKDVRANILSHFQNMGSQEYDQLIDMLADPDNPEGGTVQMKQGIHSNAQQINSRLKSLMEYGLTQADINTLKSDFLTRTFNQTGHLATEREAGQAVIDYVKGIAEGYNTDKSSLSKSPKTESALQQAELKGKESMDLFMLSLNRKVPGSKLQTIGVTKDYKGQYIDLEVLPVSQKILEKSRGNFTKGDQKFPRMNASELDLFTVTSQEPILINANTGSPQALKGFRDVANEAVLDTRQDFGVLRLYKSRSTGRMLTIEEVQQLTTEAERTGVIPDAIRNLEPEPEPKLYVTAGFILPRSEHMDEQLNEAGYKAVDLSTDEQDYFTNNVNNNLPVKGGYYSTWNDHYKVQLMFEATPEALRMISGENVKIETSHAHAATMSVKDKSVSDFIVPEDVRRRNLQRGGYYGASALDD